MCTLLWPHVQGSISIFIWVYEYIHAMWKYTKEQMFTPVCTSPSHMCVVRHRLYQYIFRTSERVEMCASLHPDPWKQIKKLHMSNWMQNTTYIHAHINTHMKWTYNSKNDRKHTTNFLKKTWKFDMSTYINKHVHIHICIYVNNINH